MCTTGQANPNRLRLKPVVTDSHGTALVTGPLTLKMADKLWAGSTNDPVALVGRLYLQGRLPGQPRSYAPHVKHMSYVKIHFVPPDLGTSQHGEHAFHRSVPYRQPNVKVFPFI